MIFTESRYNFETARVTLRIMENHDATDRYANWLNDPEVNKYLGTKSATIEELRQYIAERDEQSDALFFGVFRKEDDLHIGTVKLEPIEIDKKRATIAVMIGEKECWGKGFAGEAMQPLIDWCFTELGLEEVNLGVLAENTSAIRVYEKLGFTETKRELQSVHYGKDIYDHIFMAQKRSSWLAFE